MASLTPGTVVIITPPALTVTGYAPNAVNFNYGAISIVKPDGYLYTPPLIGQIWPRGDYKPL